MTSLTLKVGDSVRFPQASPLSSGTIDLIHALDPSTRHIRVYLPQNEPHAVRVQRYASAVGDVMMLSEITTTVQADDVDEYWRPRFDMQNYSPTMTGHVTKMKYDYDVLHITVTTVDAPPQSPPSSERKRLNPRNPDTKREPWNQGIDWGAVGGGDVIYGGA